jgi:hypothetical protein
MVMRKHQRYFPVFSSAGSGELLPYFITVANGQVCALECVCVAMGGLALEWGGRGTPFECYALRPRSPWTQVSSLCAGWRRSAAPRGSAAQPLAHHTITTSYSNHRLPGCRWTPPRWRPATRRC